MQVTDIAETVSFSETGVPDRRAIKGHLTGLSGTVVFGWAFDPGLPDSAVDVSVWVDDRKVATGPADHLRKDLEDQETGESRCGYSFDIKDSLLDGFPHRIRVTAGSDDQELSGDVLFSPYSGHVDEVVNGQITGWVCNRGRPDAPVTVDLILNGETVVSAVADVHRPDLVAAGIGNGNHGYALPIPARLLSDEAMEATVEISGTGIMLDGSPVTIGPMMPLNVPAVAETGRDRKLDTDAIRANALRFRRALEAQGLWMSEPLSDETATDGDPVLLCFDAAYYRSATPALPEDATVEEAFAHFRAHAATSILRPNMLFDEFWYQRRYIDVPQRIAVGHCGCGLDHFLRSGLSANRSPTLWFDAAHYAGQFATPLSLMEHAGSAFLHFLEEGARAGLAPSRLFDPIWYLHKYPEVERRVQAGTIGSAFAHYLIEGGRQGYAAIASFNETGFVASRPQVARAIKEQTFRSGFEWFILYGLHTGDCFEQDHLLKALVGRTDQMISRLNTLTSERRRLVQHLEAMQGLTRSWMLEAEAIRERGAAVAETPDLHEPAVAPVAKPRAGGTASRICRFEC